MAIAGAGVLASIPGLSGLLGAAETAGPAADASVAGAEDAAVGATNLSEPLVAQVRDLSTGEISLFNGTREVIVRDPKLASQLARAIH